MSSTSTSMYRSWPKVGGGLGCEILKALACLARIIALECGLRIVCENLTDC